MNEKSETSFNFEKERKDLCLLLQLRLRNPALTREQRLDFLTKLRELVNELPPL